MGSQSSKLSAPPPPYEDNTQEQSNALNSSVSPLPNKKIRLSKPAKVPQWKWSTNQCREWLAATYVHTFHIPVEEALALADKFEGSGPMIYLTTRGEWFDLLGYHRGRSLSTLIRAVRDEPGAMPKHVPFDWKLDSKNYKTR